MRTLPVVYVSAVIDGGSHPFPFRTRKLSLLSPMVLGLRARESRSLQDSRPLGRKRPRGLFFMPASLRSALATMPGQYRALVAHAPCLTASGSFFLLEFSAISHADGGQHQLLVPASP